MADINQIGMRFTRALSSFGQPLLSKRLDRIGLVPHLWIGAGSQSPDDMSGSEFIPPFSGKSGVRYDKIVKGRSMYPFLSEGDLIGYLPIESPGIKVGDVLLYRDLSRKGLICHRVIKKQGEKIYVKGDNDLSRPLPVEIAAVEGKIILLRRNGRNMLLNTIRHRLFSRVIALLSSMNLTPGNLRERFVLQIYDRFLANFSNTKFFKIIIPVEYRYFKFCEPGNPNRGFKIRAFDNKNRLSGSIDLYIKNEAPVKTGFIGPWVVRRRAKGRDLAEKLLQKIIALATVESLTAIFACAGDKRVLARYKELGFSRDRRQDGAWWMSKRDFTASDFEYLCTDGHRLKIADDHR